MNQLDSLYVELVLLHPVPDLIRQSAGDDALRLQRPEAFENDGHCDHGAGDDRQHEPTAGLHDLEHDSLWAPLEDVAKL